MNVKLELRPPVIWGGIFSQFMVMLPNAVPYDVDNIFFDVNDGYGLCNENPFDWVFDQKIDDSYVTVPCKHRGTYTHSGMQYGGYLGAIEDCASFPAMRKICTKIKIRQEILDNVTKYSPLIDDNMTGVHIRLGEMNTIHPQYGIASTQSYIDRIRQLNPSSIFLASDNNMSVRAIKESVPCKVVCVDDFYREEVDNISTDKVHMDMLYKDYYWREVWADMLLLSKCKELLCRVSNFANASILFSETPPKVHRL